MADLRRFELFARFLAERFAARRIYDVAGGMGRLNQALAALGREVTTFDVRHKRLPHLRYAERPFTLDEPCACELVVGMHPDGATRLIVEYAARHRIPFAVVPCCSDNGMPYNPWMRHLGELARSSGFAGVDEAKLEMSGRSRVLWGEWAPRSR